MPVMLVIGTSIFTVGSLVMGGKFMVLWPDECHKNVVAQTKKNMFRIFTEFYKFCTVMKQKKKTQTTTQHSN